MSSDFINRFVEAERRIAELERRLRNRTRAGVISEVDTKKGLARVKIKDGDRPYITPWMPWKEIAAGGIKTHIPPTVGEQVDVVSENGDLTDAVIDMSTPSDKNPRPHDGADAVITKGSVRMFISGDHVKIDAPNITYTASGGELA
jgi:phage baseplate assembly protein V